jgi:hypothetical protein
MKKLVLLLVSVVPVTAFAAPAGHDICSGSLWEEKIQLVIATGALCCDATLRIAKVDKNARAKTYEFSADIEDGIFSAKSDAGSIRYRLRRQDRGRALVREHRRCAIRQWCFDLSEAGF